MSLNKSFMSGFKVQTIYDLSGFYFNFVTNLFLFSIHKNKRTYFYSGFLAYFLGLAATIFVMHVFKHAQVNTFMAFLAKI